MNDLKRYIITGAGYYSRREYAQTLRDAEKQARWIRRRDGVAVEVIDAESGATKFYFSAPKKKG